MYSGAMSASRNLVVFQMAPITTTSIRLNERHVKHVLNTGRSTKERTCIVTT